MIFVILLGGSSSETNKQKILINKLQKRRCRVILDYNVEDTSQAMDILNILSIYDRLYRRKVKFMLKVYQHITNDYISEQSTLRNNVNTSVNLISATACCFFYVSSEMILQTQFKIFRMSGLEQSA